MRRLLPAFLALTIVRLLSQAWAERRSARDERPTLYEGTTLSGHILYGCYLLAWTSALGALLRGPSTGARSVAGMVLLFLGMVLRFLALPALGRDFASHIVVRQDQRLVTHGIYGVVRHPLQLGLLIEILGMAILSRGLFAWAILLVTSVAVSAKNRSEDRVLRQVLGAAAAQYQARVPGVNLPVGLLRLLTRVAE